MEKIVKVNTYNTYLYEFLTLLKGNKLAFALWVEALKPNGSKIHFETLNTSLALNYNSSRELGKSFLKPMKILMDDSSLTSFNYTVDGDHINLLTKSDEEFYQTYQVNKKALVLAIKKIKIYYNTKKKQLLSFNSEAIFFILIF